MKKISFTFASLLVCLFISVSASAETVTFGLEDLSVSNSTAVDPTSLLDGANVTVIGSQWTLTLPNFVIDETYGLTMLDIKIPVSSTGYINAINFTYSGELTGDATGEATELFSDLSNMTLATKKITLFSGNIGSFSVSTLVSNGSLIKSIVIDPGIGGTASLTTIQQSVKAVPEPMTLSLLGLGLASLGFSRRKRNR